MHSFSQEEKEMLFSFRANHKQKAKLYAIFSDCEFVNHVVPPVTVLGPLIFQLNVNNSSSIINTTEKLIQFADNTRIVCCGREKKLTWKSQGKFT